MKHHITIQSKVDYLNELWNTNIITTIHDNLLISKHIFLSFHQPNHINTNFKTFPPLQSYHILCQQLRVDWSVKFVVRQSWTWPRLKSHVYDDHVKVRHAQKEKTIDPYNSWWYYHAHTVLSFLINILV